MGAYEEPKETCGTICLKYLLFAFNFLFWVSLGSVGSGVPLQRLQTARSVSEHTRQRRKKRKKKPFCIFKESKIGIIG